MTDIAQDPPRQLSGPLEQLLTSGGDTRLALDPISRLNFYGCRPFPRSDAFTFASSTATSISGRAYAAAAAARQSLLRDSKRIGFAHAFDLRMENLGDELKELLDLRDSGCEIVFSPSGTDSQLHALFLARAILGTPLVSVIAAADETGSGTAFAARGRHFNAVTAQGIAVVKGVPVPGLSEGIEAVAAPMRDEAGAMRRYDDTDGDIAHAVVRSVAAGRRVLLFAMDRSKLGLRSPSLDCLRWIASASGEEVQIVIDACQTRLGRKRLRWYLDQGFMVLVTGSKFFTGAPFSGAVLVPERLAARCRELDRVPPGLRDYTNRSDWPLSWRGLRAALPSRANLGQWLRWVSALEEMRAYAAVPLSFRELALRQFAERVPGLIAAETCLEPLALSEAGPDDIDDEEMAVRTIFPFVARRAGRLLSQAQATMLYRAVNDDVAALLPAHLPPMQRLLARRRCHIGQPVAVADGGGGVAGALRISAGARIASESWDDDILVARENLRGELDQVRAILEKIGILVRYFAEIERFYRQPNPVLPYHVSAA